MNTPTSLTARASDLDRIFDELQRGRGGEDPEAPVLPPALPR